VSELNPRNSDAVLGGQNPAPINAAILGGLAGAKQRLESESLVTKLQALKDTIQYGSDGINLALQALCDPNEDVKRLARRLLRTQAGVEGRSALLERQPLSYFTTLSDWRWEIYNPEIGIIDPENNAYVVSMTHQNRWSNNHDDLSQFESLIKDPKIGELQALIFQIDPGSNNSFGVALEAIVDAHSLLPNLRGLFVGDSRGDNAPEYRRSTLPVFDIKPFLEAFPDLQILQVFGRFDDRYKLECGGVRHENLKTLVIETAHLSEDNLHQIGDIDLPNLEYFELWLGKSGHDPSEIITALTPILSGMVTVELKYLGLCSHDNTDGLIAEVLMIPVLEILAVLDFKMGTMTDKGVDTIVRDPDLDNLKYLNLFGNHLSEQSIVKLQQLPFQVDTSNPHQAERFSDAADYRRWALHE
jgi:hypothetical protein